MIESKCKHCGGKIRKHFYGNWYHEDYEASKLPCWENAEPSDTTPQKNPSCLNCRFSKACFVSSGIESNVMFGVDAYSEIADVIGKHCKLFEEDLK